jgi:outer membrane receptor protein involved in Fe transport
MQVGKDIIFGMFIGFLLLSIQVSAQTGAISGVIKDGEDKTPLPGVNIFLENSNLGTSTDIDGRFTLVGLPEGEQVLMISFISYQTERIPVILKAGEVYTVDVDLEVEAVQGVEVIVTAQAQGQAQAISQQLNSDALVNIVSADRIQELPDVNAAEAIARLPGIGIDRSGGEGQKVVIRGMQPKFAAITLNGVSLPSNSSTDRSVDLSLISPELLDGIEVYKAPLPYMDAEAIGGTVNLKLRKAAEEFKMTAKLLGGANFLNSDYGDYKGVLQMSKRLLAKKQLGFVIQGGVERFNRGGDIQTNNWRRGPTDAETGITSIFGNSLRLEDRQEIRRRYNTSISLDYDLEKHDFSFFGIYSRTERDRFVMEERFLPSEPGIEYWGRGIDNQLDLYSLSFTGEHILGPLKVDWTVSSSETRGETPYDFSMRFVNNSQVFDASVDPNGQPSTFFSSAKPELSRSLLRSNSFQASSTNEKTNTALVNIQLPIRINDWLQGYLQVGGKYKTIDRTRSLTRQAEDFYYLGGGIVNDAVARYDGPITFLPDNNQLISILSFTAEENDIEFENETGGNIGLSADLDPDRVRDWYEAQRSILNTDRSALLENYSVEEQVSAGYIMMKLNVGKKITVIPGVRYEASNNVYSGGISTLNGWYGVNGTFNKTTSEQVYDELLPHLHIKYEPLPWLDIRWSSAQTLARPDFLYVTPRTEIDDNQTRITTGNPDLSYAKATNYDLSFAAYKGGWGLFSAGVFYKEVDNIFYPWTTNLFDQETADAFGFPDNRGYELSSYINSPESRVYGYELELQANLMFLPKPFSGIVLNANYARLYSETEVFFLTSETRLIVPVPPIFETTFTNTSRAVNMPSQSPHILRLSIGYDVKGFSARVSGAYQGEKVQNYSVNKDFDTFTADFWRWDASCKQRLGDHWSVFLNLNNLTNQQDISFTRTEAFLNTIENYGFTGSIGVQYKI